MDIYYIESPKRWMWHTDSCILNAGRTYDAHHIVEVVFYFPSGYILFYIILFFSYNSEHIVLWTLF